MIQILPLYEPLASIKILLLMLTSRITGISIRNNENVCKYFMTVIELEEMEHFDTFLQIKVSQNDLINYQKGDLIEVFGLQEKDTNVITAYSCKVFKQGEIDLEILKKCVDIRKKFLDLK